MIPAITKPQLKRLNTLYGQWAKRTLLDAENTREARIAEIAGRSKRPISSTGELTVLEAKQVIDSFQAEFGIAQTRPPQPRSRRDRQKAGTEGRHDQRHAESTMVSAGSIARIESELARLGWNQTRLEAFLQSRTGPLKGRTQIRTLGDANKVYWSLKRMQPPEARQNAS